MVGWRKDVKYMVICIVVAHETKKMEGKRIELLVAHREPGLTNNFSVS